LPVILVVGMRLGCLSHALLTHEAIVSSEVPFAGWIANAVDSGFSCLEENIETLKSALAVPCLGVIPNFNQTPGNLQKRFTQGDLFQAGREEILRRLAV
jgi:dethiobiotin synthetase